MRYVKGHGTGNDFVILPDADGDLELPAALVRALCHRGTGIGADGVLRVVLSAAEPAAEQFRGEARWFMDYRNADGSVAEMCGNGIRVFARYLVDAGYEAAGTLLIATRAGLRTVEVPPAGDVSVDMGPPEFAPGPVPVTVVGREFAAVPVSMGNPHAVCFADDLGPAQLAGLDLRAPVYPAEIFADGVNVEVVVPTPGGVAMRVFERGVGETASCGTGACAVAVAWAAREGGGPPAEVQVDLPGGRLTVGWDERTVVLRGPAVLVSDGVLRPEWLRLVAGPPGADAAATDPAGTDAAGREAAGTEAAPSAAGRAAAGV
ncbi:diaminopimelate epimerase [Parafrankia colletiae]|uniref:Diaminopimelate epimerase n=1 Tax=Parafrankia colletiae TaxID=573497 RepID=A0A1S1RBC0_9ACTN|nr:diaminopimelate epimerase [Parafrankia colletiae]OHV44103.1 diaminopimelate epimerase [Parafrankia colletiae]